VAYDARPAATRAMRDWIGTQVAGPQVAASRVAQGSVRVQVEAAFALAVLRPAA